MLFAPLFGYFGDRHSRKLIMTIGVLIWVVATLVGSFMPVSTLDGDISWLFVWQLRLVAYTSNIKDDDVFYHLSRLKNDFNPFKSAIHNILKTKAEIKSFYLLFLGLPFVPCHASHGRHWGGQLLHDRANHHQRFVCQRNEIENVGYLLFRHSSWKVNWK